MKRTPLRKQSNSETAVLKREVQGLVRNIVILRDQGCILKSRTDFAPCSGYAPSGYLVLQANHLVSRGKNVGYANTDLIVCMCKGHHKGYHSQQEERYRQAIRELIGDRRARLWDLAEADQKSHNMSAWDWQKEVLALKQELAGLYTS